MNYLRLQTVLQGLTMGMLWCLGGSAFAQTAGALEKINAPATIWSAAGTQKAAVMGAKVEVGDLIETTSGEVVIHYHDQAVTTLGPNTRFKIERYGIQDVPGATMVFTLITGYVRSVTGVMGKANPEAFRLNAPTATVGVRGTDFVAQAASGLTVAVVSGIVEVKNDARSTVLTAGNQLSLTSRSSPHTVRTEFSAPMGKIVKDTQPLLESVLKIEKSEKSERTERTERTEKAEKSEKSEKMDSSDSSGKSESSSSASGSSKSSSNSGRSSSSGNSGSSGSSGGSGSSGKSSGSSGKSK